MDETAPLITRPMRTGAGLDESVANAIALWADSSSDPESPRHADLVRLKAAAVRAFFLKTGKPPSEAGPIDVKAWRDELERAGLALSTVYARISFLSSFYRWLMADPVLGQHIIANPARLARPKAPKAYQTEATKALTDEQLQRLLAAVREDAGRGGLPAKRDHALFLMFVMSGMRRAEVLRLRGRDVEFHEGGMVVTCRVKGGDYLGRMIANPAVRSALEEYLRASGRMYILGTDGPLWTRHDRAGDPGLPLSEWAFVRRMKEYASQAGLDHFHLHQTRHTFARIVAETSGSFMETQDALGHKNPATTRAYVRRIAIKRDKFGDEIAKRLKL